MSGKPRKGVPEGFETLDGINRFLPLDLGGAEWHADTPHWDTGHADTFHDGHYDLHGDMPHWDHTDDADRARHADEGDQFRDPWATVVSEQRFALEWTRQILDRLEQRLSAVEERLRDR